MLSVWLRAIRVKFLLASVIAVSLGLSLAWYSGHSIDIIHALLTFAGVISLHASVDLLNDYWDFKRGIDTKTKRTKMSGGTGVLPEGLLKPKSVYAVGSKNITKGTNFKKNSIVILIFEFPKDILVKVRSTGKLLKAKVDLKANNSAEVNLKDLEDGISPGQACVFYLKDDFGDKVLGGGWIDKTYNKNLST